MSVVVSLAVGAALSFAIGSDVPPPTIGADSTAKPGSARVDARADGPRGTPEVGVLVYENRDGRTCIAAGHVSEQSVGRIHASGRFVPAPLEHVGDCGVTPDPVAVHVERVRNLPATEEDEGETTIWGIARSDVTELVVEAGGTRRVATLGSAGAFVLTYPEEITGAVVLDARVEGSVVRVVLPAGPDLDELSEQARANAPRR